jgi:hypothetical protein
MRIKQIFEKRQRYYTKVGRKEEEDEAFYYMGPSIFNEIVYALAFAALVGLAIAISLWLY